MITFDSSWSNLLSQLSLLPNSKHCVPFFSTCCTFHVLLCKFHLLLALLFFVHGFSGPGPWLFCSMGSRVPSLAVSLSSRPFGTCFIQPTTHPLGLKASVVHDHCKRRRCLHRTSNLLNASDVKGLQYVTMCILPSSINCTFVTRLAKHSVSTACQAARLKSDIHTCTFMYAGVPTLSNLFFFFSLSLASSEFII